MKIDRFIDMYISREHKLLLEKEIEKMYERGIKVGAKKVSDLDWHRYTFTGEDKNPHYPQILISKIKFDNYTFSYGKDDSLTVTFTLNIDNTLQVENLEIANSLGRGFEEEKKRSKDRVVSISIVDILKDMEGMEVGDEIK